MYRIDYAIPKISTKRPTQSQVDLAREVALRFDLDFPYDCYSNYNLVRDLIESHGFHKDAPDLEKYQTGYRLVASAREKFYIDAPLSKEEDIIVALNQEFGREKWVQENIEVDPEDISYAEIDRLEEEAAWSCL